MPPNVPNLEAAAGQPSFPPGLSSPAKGLLNSLVSPTLITELGQALSAHQDSQRRIPVSHFNPAQALAVLEGIFWQAATNEIINAEQRGVLQRAPAYQVAVNLDSFEVRSVLLRSYSHWLKGQPCQDAIFDSGISAAGNRVIAICDGVSSVPLAHYGAQFLAQASANLALQLIERPDAPKTNLGSILVPSFSADLQLLLAKAQIELCETLHIHPIDAGRLFNSATLQLLVLTPSETFILAASDGYVDVGAGAKEISRLSNRRLQADNSPPLLALALEEAAIKQLVRNGLPQYGIPPNELPFYNEGRTLKIVAYLPTAKLLDRSTVMWSDGFTYVAATETDTHQLPIPAWLKKHGYKQELVQEATALYHLAFAARELQLDMEAEASLSALNNTGGALPLSAGTFSAWLDTQSSREHALKRTVLFLRSKGHRGLANVMNEEPTVREQKISNEIEITKGRHSLQDFAAFITDAGIRTRDAGYAIAQELLGTPRQPASTEFVVVFMEALALAVPDQVGAAQAHFNRFTEGASFNDKFAILLTSETAFEPYKSWLLQKCGSGAEYILRANFGLDPAEIVEPLYDDLAGVLVRSKV